MAIVNEESNILPYVQVNKFASYNVIDGGKRHKTVGSETKDSLLISSGAVTRVWAFAPVAWAPVPTGCCKEA